MHILIKLLCLAIVVYTYLSAPSVLPDVSAEQGCAITKIGNPTGPSPVITPPCGAGLRGPVSCPGSMSNYECAYKHILDYSSYCCRYNPPHMGVDLIADAGVPQYAIEELLILDTRFSGCVQPSVWDAQNPPGSVSGPGSRRCYPSDDDPDGQRWFHGKSTGWHVLAKGVESKRYYYHFHLISKSPIPEGQIVPTGTIIAYTGRTGHSPGPPHLHLQVTPPNCFGCWSNPDIMFRHYPSL